MWKNAEKTARLLALRLLERWKFPPYDNLALLPQLALLGPSHSGTTYFLSADTIGRTFQTLWGVPKHRTAKPIKQTRKFSYNKLLTPFTNLTTCDACKTPREMHTICAVCYTHIRDITNQIKEKMMAYNPYVGERQNDNKEVHVHYEDDPPLSDEIRTGKRVIEVKFARPELK
jgi:ribosomal protein L32